MLQWFNKMNLVQRYSLVALLVLLLAMIILAWWVGREIESNVINRVAADSALFVENFVVLPLQDLVSQDSISPTNLAKIDNLLTESSLGNNVITFKIWAPNGRIVFGDRMGEVFPVTEDQQHAWDGMVSAEISRLDDSENINLKEQFSRLLEMYIPIRHEGTERVIAVVEFYQTVEELEKNVGNAKRQSWLIVALTMLSAYGLLVGIVRQGHQTILKQQNDLNNKVEELNILLEKNSELSERVRRAASRTAALNERFMRRISAELHDGPAQDMSFSLLHLDNVASALDKDLEESKKGFYHKALDTIHQSLNRATQEIRNIASGLRLPELETLSPVDILERVIRDHERRTQSKVTIESKNLPKHLQVPLKVTLFRLIQEALTNAFRHGQGKEQKVKVDLLGQGKLLVEISDQGPGFNPKGLHEGRLGLMGMRERVESLGGTFEITSNPGQGTKVSVHLPLSEDLYE